MTQPSVEYVSPCGAHDAVAVPRCNLYACGVRRTARVVALAVAWSAVGACGGKLETNPAAPSSGGAGACAAGSSAGRGGSSGASGGSAAGTGGSIDGGVHVDAGTGSAGAKPTCLPNFVHGPLISEDLANGTHVYESCDGNQIVILLDGAMPTMDQVTALNTTFVDAAFAIPGIVGVVAIGDGVCCASSLDSAPCANLELDRNGTPLGELPAKLAAIVNDDLCVAFVVEQTGFEGPRCEPGEPACIPEPYCSDLIGPSICCPKSVTYDPCRPRTPVPEYANLASPCTHDGECYQGGCGNECYAYTDISYAGHCDCRLALQDALCGCVNGSCQWFVQ